MIIFVPVHNKIECVGLLSCYEQLYFQTYIFPVAVNESYSWGENYLCHKPHSGLGVLWGVMNYGVS